MDCSFSADHILIKKFDVMESSKFNCFNFCVESVNESICGFTFNIIMPYKGIVYLLLMFKEDKFGKKYGGISFGDLMKNQINFFL